VIDLTTGVVAVTGKLPATGGAVDLGNLPSGMYVFMLDDGMGNLAGRLNPIPNQYFSKICYKT